MKFGCSSITWDTLDNKHLLGRTYDQSGNLDGNGIAVVPRNFKMNTAPCKNSRFLYTRYSYTGMAVMGLDTPIMVDGINEKGLMGALLYYPGYAVYNTKLKEENINLHPAFLTSYLLGQCNGVEEAVEHLSRIALTNEKIFGQEMPVHYIFSDSTGEAVIIEPESRGLAIYRDTIGVLANSPDYMWHKTNLRNYVPVANLVTPPHKMLNSVISGFGDTSGGGFGLPGDYSSPSRFVRTAFIKNFAVKGNNEIDGITKMFKNFSSVDIPEGILKPYPGYEYYEQTLCTSAMCSESLTYYFSTSSNRRISAVCLEKEKNNPKIKYYGLQEKQDILYLN